MHSGTSKILFWSIFGMSTARIYFIFVQQPIWQNAFKRTTAFSSIPCTFFSRVFLHFFEHFSSWMRNATDIPPVKRFSTPFHITYFNSSAYNSSATWSRDIYHNYCNKQKTFFSVVYFGVKSIEWFVFPCGRDSNKNFFTCRLEQTLSRALARN